VQWVGVGGQATATSGGPAFGVWGDSTSTGGTGYVARKTAAGFEVREHGGGDLNVAFDYRIVVRRRGYESIRMAEVDGDVKTLESSRQHLAELANSGNLKNEGVVKAPLLAPAPTIRPVPPRPSIPQPPKVNAPLPPKTLQ
jgi:hypothetical protein